MGSLFWIIPLLLLGIFFLRTWLKKRELSGSVNQKSSFSTAETQKSVAGKELSGRIPEELKRAGQQVLENLDWEIRFLEKQRLEVTDVKERQEIDEKLTQKREEYHTTVERLEP